MLHDIRYFYITIQQLGYDLDVYVWLEVCRITQML